MPLDARPAPPSRLPDSITTAAAAAAAMPDPNARAIARWLLVVAGMVWLMIAVGGATRLTGSGLSIMEWAPLSGTLPPLSEAEWNRLYALYQTIPQYALVNRGFGLEGFKEIFWLEWFHRLWGRLIGVVFLLPLVWFWLRGRIPAGLAPRLVLLLVLGGMQGAVGWFMVASGFEADRTAVSPYRLVVHLGLALVLYAALLWTALALLRPSRPAAAGGGRDDAAAAAAAADPPRALRQWVHAATGLAVLTMLAGGFVAGIRAGLDYNTFPLMEGRLVPEGYWRLETAWRNLTANIPAVQFNHRLLATLTLLVAAGAALCAWRRLPPGARARRAAFGLLAAVAAQYGLGIATLVMVVPVWLGTLHQAAAVLVLTAALVALHALPRRGGGAGPATAAAAATVAAPQPRPR